MDFGCFSTDIFRTHPNFAKQNPKVRSVTAELILCGHSHGPMAAMSHGFHDHLEVGEARLLFQKLPPQLEEAQLLLEVAIATHVAMEDPPKVGMGWKLVGLLLLLRYNVVYMYIYIYVYMIIYVYIYTCIYIYIHIY